MVYTGYTGWFEGKWYQNGWVSGGGVGGGSGPSSSESAYWRNRLGQGQRVIVGRGGERVFVPEGFGMGSGLGARGDVKGRCQKR